MLKSCSDLCELIEEVGFLPFFRNPVSGFSIEDCTPPELWFSDEADGPWEWKGPVIRDLHCAYGKFYRGKAMYISERFFGDFCNFRRDGYDYDARMDDGLARHADIPIMRELWQSPSVVSRELKARVCFTKERKRTFDGSLTRLQMLGYINIADFEYALDRCGRPYGWGLARYTTPEAFFGENFLKEAYKTDPTDSYKKLESYLQRLLPDAGVSQIENILKI